MTAGLQGLGLGSHYVPPPTHLPIHPPVRNAYGHSAHGPPGYVVAPQDYYASAAYASPPYHYAHHPLPVSYEPVQPYPPGYVPNGNGLPVNASHGVVQKEYKVVIFKNLDPEITSDELRYKMRKTVEPARLTVKPPLEGKRHTTAIATFNNYKEVKEVVEYFKRKDVQFKGRRLTAQIGKDSDPPKKEYTVVSSTLPNA